MAKEVINSKIRSSRKFMAERGKIISSFVSAKMGFESKEIGTDVSHPCRINVGLDENVKKRIQAFDHILKIKRRPWKACRKNLIPNNTSKTMTKSQQRFNFASALLCNVRFKFYIMAPILYNQPFWLSCITIPDQASDIMPVIGLKLQKGFITMKFISSQILYFTRSRTTKRNFRLLFPFTFIQFFYGPWLEAQSRAKTPRELPENTRGHVIMTSFDPLTINLIEKLEKYNYPYVILAPDLQFAGSTYVFQFMKMLGESLARRTLGMKWSLSEPAMLKNVF